MTEPSAREMLLRIASDRLYPSLASPNFPVLRARRINFQNWIRGFSSRELTILDVGGRYQPYRPLLKGREARYISCDIQKTELVDVVASGEALPFMPGTFDLAISTQVFEYFERPHEAARQIHAALKREGILLMSVASCTPRFVEEEHWRFTPRGIRSVLSCFTEVEIIPEIHSIAGLLRTVNLALHSFAYFKLARSLYELTVCPCLNIAALGVEALNLTKDDRFAPNYSVLAIK